MKLHSNTRIQYAFTSNEICWLKRTHTLDRQAWASNQNALANDLHKKSYKYLFICIHLHALKVPSGEKREKVHSHFWHSLLLPRKKNEKKILFFLYGILLCSCFCYFIDIGIDFCFSELFLNHFVFLFGFASSRKSQRFINLLLKKRKMSNWKNFVEYSLYWECERESCVDAILM